MINASSSACLIHRRTKSCASSPVRLHLPFGYIEHVIHADHWPAGFLMAILWVTLQPISVSNGSYLAINTKPPQHMLHPWLHVSKSVGPVCTVLLYCAGLGFCYCAVVVGGGCMGHIHMTHVFESVLWIPPEAWSHCWDLVDLQLLSSVFSHSFLGLGNKMCYVTQAQVNIALLSTDTTQIAY